MYFRMMCFVFLYMNLDEFPEVCGDRETFLDLSGSSWIGGVLHRAFKQTVFCHGTGSNATSTGVELWTGILRPEHIQKICPQRPDASNTLL